MTAGFAVVNAVTALSTSYTLTIVARILAGIFAGVLWPLVGSYASRLVSPQNMGRAIAIALTGSTIALAIGLPLATALVGVLGWRTIFWGLTLLAIILCVWVSLKVPSFPGESAQNRVPFNQVLKIPGMPKVLIVTFTTLLAHYVLYTYIAPYTEALHFRGGTSLALLLFGLGTLVGIALTGKLIDTHFRKTTLGTVLLTALSMLLIGSMGNLPLIAHLSILLWGVSFGGAPTLFQTAANKVADKAKDVANSLIVTVYNTGIFGGSLAGGLILSTSSAFAFPWTVFVLVLISIMFIWNGYRNAFPRTDP
jgi:predicted MFS family arabinose efflux permease